MIPRRRGQPLLCRARRRLPSSIIDLKSSRSCRVDDVTVSDGGAKLHRNAGLPTDGAAQRLPFLVDDVHQPRSQHDRVQVFLGHDAHLLTAACADSREYAHFKDLRIIALLHAVDRYWPAGRHLRSRAAR